MKVEFKSPFEMEQAHEGDAGFDVRANEDTLIYPGQYATVPTGLYMAIPVGYYAKVASRSGLAFRMKVTAFHGTLDSSYRGEVKVLLHNGGERPAKLKLGDKIAQLIFLKHESPSMVFKHGDLDETVRGSSGFGSTDKNE